MVVVVSASHGGASPDWEGKRGLGRRWWRRTLAHINLPVEHSAALTVLPSSPSHLFPSLPFPATCLTDTSSLLSSLMLFACIPGCILGVYFVVLGILMMFYCKVHQSVWLLLFFHYFGHSESTNLLVLWKLFHCCIERTRVRGMLQRFMIWTDSYYSTLGCVLKKS